MNRVELTTNKRKAKACSCDVTQLRLLVDIDETHKAGDLGGWVISLDSVTNPATGEADGVVLDEAEVTNEARVYENGILRDTARMSGVSEVYGNANVGGNTRMTDTAVVDGNVLITSDCLLYGTSKITGDVELIANLDLKEGVVSESPYQIEGSKHNMILWGDSLTIGCKGYPLSHWVASAREIGEEQGYTALEIAMYIKDIAKVMAKHKKNSKNK